jgi:hypothetical protein
MSNRIKRFEGSATIIAMLVLGLLTIFVAVALSRITTDALIVRNEVSQSNAFYAAEAGLETMSRNFEKIFDAKLNPSKQDLTALIHKSKWPHNFSDYTFNQVITPDDPGAIKSQTVLISGGTPYDGLMAIQDRWDLLSTATDPIGGQVQLKRSFLNNRIPIFQFAAFYEGDLELHPGPPFYLSGRVHSNGNLYLLTQSGMFFKSRVSASKEVVTDVARNGYPWTHQWNNNRINIKNASGVYQKLRIGEGSVTGGPDTTNSDPDVPNGSKNTNWESVKARFDNNLLAHIKPLKLPLQTTNSTANNIEIIKRGKPNDNLILSSSRYYNKPGIRITLSDSRTKLPAGTGGVRLDGADNGAGGENSDGSRGYLPTTMTDGYQATRFNGNRLFTGTSYDNQPRQTWIKVEIVKVDASTLAVTTTDITQDFLSLGFTERVRSVPGFFQVLNPSYDNQNIDSRSIIKLQRFVIPGLPVMSGSTSVGGRSLYTYTGFHNSFHSTYGVGYNYVQASNTTSAPNGNYLLPQETSRYPVPTSAGSPAGNGLRVGVNNTPNPLPQGLLKPVTLVPFPIKMFDTREGLYNDDLNAAALYAQTLPLMGVMSLIDVDVYNLKLFMRGDFNGKFANGLTSTQIPKDNGGIILYVSDRRGDRDDDGEFDMENIYVNANNPNSDNSMQYGEDVNGNGTLDMDYTWEAARYRTGGGWQNAQNPAQFVSSSGSPLQFATANKDLATFFDHRYFRRGVRVINGEQLPAGGFTLASENGVYILGNYNATGVRQIGDPANPGEPTPWNHYLPSPGVPASIAADAITFLSNSWKDATIFNSPFTIWNRPTTMTTYRLAMITGTTRTSLYVGAADGGTPHAGSTHQRMNGALHEGIIRFLELWGTPTYFNHCGSIVNFFNSRNNNGSWKLSQDRWHVFTPPDQNRTFDESFLDQKQLPPGTPFFQYIYLTGFRRTNR